MAIINITIIPLIIMLVSIILFVISLVINKFLKINQYYFYLLVGFLFGAGGLATFNDDFYIVGNASLIPTYFRYLLFSIFVFIMFVSFRIINSKSNKKLKVNYINLLINKVVQFVIGALFSFFLLKNHVDNVLFLSLILGLMFSFAGFNLDFSNKTNSYCYSINRVVNSILSVCIVVTLAYFVGGFVLIYQSAIIFGLTLLLALCLQFLTKNIADQILKNKIDAMLLAILYSCITMIIVVVISNFYIDNNKLAVAALSATIGFGYGLAKFNFGKVNHKIYIALAKFNSYLTIPVIFVSAGALMTVDNIISKYSIMLLFIIFVIIFVSAYIMHKLDKVKLNKALEVNSERGIALICLAVIVSSVTNMYFDLAGSIVFVSVVLVIAKDILNKINNRF